MSRWADDPEGAADALILRGLGDIGLAGGVLLVNQSGALPARLESQGLSFSLWNRRLAQGLPAAPWPPSGPFDLALVRLPKARDEQAMTLHATLSVLAAGSRLLLYGGNDEGIRSAAAMLKKLAEDVEIVAARGHGRVVAAWRPASTEGLRASLAAWRTLSQLEIAGARRDWVNYPGTFAAGRLDEGTALLLSTLPPLAADARVLDYGCGSGAIAAATLALQPRLTIEAVDNDTLALEAAHENVPQARLVLGTGLADAGRRDYDAILSNPPLHSGIAEDHALLDRLLAEASSHLAPGGLLQIVVQRRVPLERRLAQHFAKVEIAAETGRYRVWRARVGVRPSGSETNDTSLAEELGRQQQRGAAADAGRQVPPQEEVERDPAGKRAEPRGKRHLHQRAGRKQHHACHQTRDQGGRHRAYPLERRAADVEAAPHRQPEPAPHLGCQEAREKQREVAAGTVADEAHAGPRRRPRRRNARVPPASPVASRSKPGASR